ncbi:hypothetical protein [Paenibacillus xylanilyticus]|uniref:DUF1440 domain-containing protein n=1 Tax=Paenibacillus xylanilyticus TaxID=248903 RepID=A0A7Y6C244_9BACL|nr:hypothetical protein [Paenibacillus xylanilyticus]NUU78693.1 hypothetical protein [Paenibacillus xylanilyticus]
MPEHYSLQQKSLNHPLPWISGSLTGVISGLFLGFFLKAIQAYTGEKVYTLLLNVDFVPWLPPTLPEWIEFTLHLGVSIIIGIFYFCWIQRSGHPLLRGILIGAVSSLLYIPLSQLSSRVPGLLDFRAISLWVMGHLLFGILLGVCGRIWKRQKGDPHSANE